MNDHRDVPEELDREIQRKHFIRAAFLAKEMKRPEHEVKDLKRKALWQMAALFRNPQGVKALANQFGLSKDQVKEILEQTAQEKIREGDDKPLGPCYDLQTGRYLAFEDWLERCIKGWDKIKLN
ncbi:MAG: hypothetical protein JRJ29_15835 [Deltaproteobacteria bacterium]|nr:hypothetical protein [Deltaproteobacteria bacterium]